LVQLSNILAYVRVFMHTNASLRSFRVASVCVVMLAALLHVNSCTEAPTVPFSYNNPLDADGFDADPFVTEWYDVCSRSAQQTPQFNDAIASRAYAYISIALYESLRQGFTDSSQSLAAVLNDVPEFPRADIRAKRYHWLVVANSAVSKVAQHMFRMAPAPVLAGIRDHESKIHSDISARFFDVQTLQNSIDFGSQIGDAVVRYASADGAGNSELNPFADEFVPGADSSSWHPEPGDQRAQLVNWGSVRPFVLRGTDVETELNPGSFPVFSTKPTSEFFNAALTSYTNFSSSQPSDRAIVYFWGNEAQSEHAISTHMVLIATQLLKAKPRSIRFAAEFMVKLSLGMADACIATYRYKYAYPLIRPTVYISRYVNPSWKTDATIDGLFVPPSPEYCSVLMAVSEHACSVFSSTFGATVSLTDRSREDVMSTVRDYFGFNQMLNEVRTAQLRSGLQFPFSIEAGSKVGKGISAIHAQRIRF
jgi:hypothetical protein